MQKLNSSFAKSLLILSLLFGFTTYAQSRVSIINTGNGELVSPRFNEEFVSFGQAGTSFRQTPFTAFGDGLVAQTARQVISSSRTEDFQTWRLVNARNNTVQIINFVSGNAIGAVGNTAIRQRRNNANNSAQLWRVSGSGSNTRFQNVRTGRYLSVSRNGALVQRNFSRNNRFQQWSVNEFITEASIDFVVAPNPATNGTTTAFITSNTNINNLRIRAITQSGATIFSQVVNIRQGANQIPIDVSRSPRTFTNTVFIILELSNGEQLAFEPIVVLN
ncbi:RICIN domain-containing protein [Aquimarina agarivorans]|uniref:RICIN domain-containing protein n=1 Tax=Aquimarina agarivorans TaxID=980584 RepID=UPI000248FD97|nr:RICIN domain-containing protein [Aquimarina agarivorans]